MPAGMFSIDSILAGRPSCKDSVLLHRNAPVVFSNLTESLYTAAGDFNGLYSHTGPPAPNLQSVNGTRIGYNNYYYGQLHVQGPTGPACCGAIPTLGSQQYPCIPTGMLLLFLCLCEAYMYIWKYCLLQRMFQCSVIMLMHCMLKFIPLYFWITS